MLLEMWNGCSTTGWVSKMRIGFLMILTPVRGVSMLYGWDFDKPTSEGLCVGPLAATSA